MIEHDIWSIILKLLLLRVIFDICYPFALLHPFLLMINDNSSVQCRNILLARRRYKKRFVLAFSSLLILILLASFETKPKFLYFCLTKRRFWDTIMMKLEVAR